MSTKTAHDKVKASPAFTAGEEPASKRIARDRKRVIVANTSKKTPETIIKNLALLKLSVTESVDGISKRLVAELAELKEAQEAVAAVESHLKDLHGIVAEADSLQVLLAAQEDARTVWAAEKAQMDRTRHWENEQYVYALKKSRQDEADILARTVEARNKEFSAAQEIEIKLLDTRAEALSHAEQELATLRENAAKFEERIDSETKRQVAIACNSLKKDLVNDHALEVMAIQNNLNLKSAELAAALNRILELNKLNSELDAKYKESSDKVQKIAERAIDGASKQAIVLPSSAQEATSNRR